MRFHSMLRPPEQPPAASSDGGGVPRLIPPPVKFSASVAVLFEAMSQPGALTFALPWKLKEPVNAKAHGGLGKGFA